MTWGERGEGRRRRGEEGREKVANESPCQPASHLP